MAFSLPNPTVPTNGQALDATPLLANIIALATAIQSFDGSQIQAGTIVGSALAATANPNTLLNATTFPFVDSGCLWSIVSSLAGTMTGGTLYYNGLPVTVNSVASHSFTASKDTYVDIDNNGNIVYQAVSNNAVSPSITANSIRVAIVVTGSSAITFVNTGQTDSSLSGFAPIASTVAYTVNDSLGNLIYPTDPQMRILGYRQLISSPSVGSGTGTTQVPGLVCPVIIPAGRKIALKFWARDLTNNSTGAATMALWDGVVTSGTLLTEAVVDTTTGHAFAEAEGLRLLSTGLHTINASLAVGANNVTAEAAATYPCYISVELR